MTDTLVSPDVETDLSTIDPNDDENTAHRFKLRDLDRAMFEGVEITAMCGYKTKAPMRAINNRTKCAKCEKLWLELEND